MMKAALIVLVASLMSTVCYGAKEFRKGCDKGATEVMCPGHKDCAVSDLMSQYKKGNDSEKGGYEECKELAAATKSQGISLEEKRAEARIKAKLADLNKEIQKDFPFIRITADFVRLELEDMHGKLTRDESCILGLSRNDESKEFDLRYGNPIKTALYNVASDDAGKDALKSKTKEIRHGFYSSWTSGSNMDLKVIE